MTVKRMDNVGIVVEDLDAAIEFFTELGLELEGRATVEGDWADAVTGLRKMRVETATCIGSATSGVPKGFSSGSPNSSGSRLPERIS